MKTREYLILVALAEADLHGQAIARAVQDLSDGRTRLWPVSLYGTLESLEEAGLIEELDDPRHRPADESEKKRFYRLTRVGHRALAAETDRLSALVKVARSRLKPQPGGVK
jgi:DNA-binding PadR family transcriptional regulator